jgi:serine/threonine protein kinase
VVPCTAAIQWLSGVCSRCAGHATRLSFTLAYAAPEVVTAHEAGQRTYVAHTAADVWSLGVIAFELLAGESAFGPFMAASDIADCVVGRKPMLWEGRRRDELLCKLGIFKGNVLECLHREPSRRPPMRAVLRGWEHILRSATRTATQ